MLSCSQVYLSYGHAVMFSSPDVWRLSLTDATHLETVTTTQPQPHTTATTQQRVVKYSCEQ